MPLTRLYLALLILLTPLFVYGQQYESMRVVKIDVIAQNLPPEAPFNQAAVRSRLQTRVGDYFSQTEFDRDLKCLAEDYDRVVPCVEVIQGEIFITLELWMKPTIREIIFCGNEKVKTKKLKKAFELSRGDLFEREEFIESFNDLKHLYLKKGFFEADLCYDILPIEGENQIDIRIDISEGRSGKIKKICFEGMTKQESKDVLDILFTKRYSLFLSWLNGQGIYHPDMIEQDRLQVINYFQNLGYADALADICIAEYKGSNKLIIQITADKGTRYKIGNISLCGNEVLTRECLYERFNFGRGSYYSPEKIRNTLRSIQDLYGVKGYLDTTVDMGLSLREDCPVYDISFSVDEGLRYYVGLIRVFGNCTTQTRVILHETLLCPGEVFDNRRLMATEARLANTGFFSSINVYAVASTVDDPSGERLYRDVYIEVEEAETGNVGLFAGLSTLDSVYGGVEVTERNFNLLGITGLFGGAGRGLRGGGEYVNAKVNFGDKQSSYILQWTKPYFMDSPWIVGFDLEKSNNRAYSRSYEVKTYGGNVHGTYIINPYLKYSLHYRARHSGIDIKDSSNEVEVVDATDQTGFISALGTSLIYDSTNNPRRATCGFRSRLSYELAGIGGNYHFMKFAYLNTYYHPFKTKGTLKMRADFQFILTYAGTQPDELPLSERFFLGGETTVRGYRPFVIGPQLGNEQPIGGVSSMLLSEEYQHNLLASPCLDGFVFVDAGYISLSEFTLGQFAASTGFGIRLNLMRNMPVMAGFGWPIHPTTTINGQKVDNAQRFFFALGGTF